MFISSDKCKVKYDKLNLFDSYTTSVWYQLIHVSRESHVKGKTYEFPEYHEKPKTATCMCLGAFGHDNTKWYTRRHKHSTLGLSEHNKNIWYAKTELQIHHVLLNYILPIYTYSWDSCHMIYVTSLLKDFNIYPTMNTLPNLTKLLKESIPYGLYVVEIAPIIARVRPSLSSSRAWLTRGRVRGQGPRRSANYC